MIQYNLYCVVCGEPFKASKKHSRTCKTTCRVALSKLMRMAQDEPTTKEQDEIIKAKLDKIKGEVDSIQQIIKPVQFDSTPKDEEKSPEPENKAIDTTKPLSDKPDEKNNPNSPKGEAPKS